MKTIAVRLKPGSDLKESIQRLVAAYKIEAGFVLTCVGGLSQATVRMAGAKPDSQDVRTFTEDLEIVSLVGTVSTNGCHLHLSFSNSEGQVQGGHLKEGTLIDPTAEIVIGYTENLVFEREFDEQTGFKELSIKAAQ